MKAESTIALLYPFPGLPAMDRGSARRVVPLAEVLAESFSRVIVLSPGDRAGQRAGGVDYQFHRPRPWEHILRKWAFYLFDGLTHHAWPGTDIRQRRQWWYYFQPRLQPSLKRQIRRVCRQSDAVVLEYPFWSSLLAPDARVLLTMHDILSEIITQPRLKGIVQSREAAACRRAQALVGVSSADCETLRARGFPATLVPHGFSFAESPGGETPHSGIREVVSRRRRGELICLFVGSTLQPNRDAVEFIKGIAADSEPGIFFAIAGACCGAMTLGPHITSFGVLAEEDLHALYHATDVVLAPVFSGSGASVKVLEALAHRKVLVASRIGVRGYELVSGGQAILSDDRTEYPGILARLRDNPGERARLAEKGHAFAQAFESGAVYGKYVEIIHQMLHDH